MYVDYKAIGVPTQPGLAVTYNSHPNIRGLLVGNDELSLVKVLDANGYDTYVLMAGSETFLNNKVFFTRLGFQHVLGLEEWERDPKLQPYIEGRGLMDRALYDQVLKLLLDNRDRKIYIHVVNTDTHGPIPRTYYGSLDYPPTPECVTSLARQGDATTIAMLTGIFRHDYDLGLTVSRMKQMNLLTDNTLVVLTADHNFPPTKALQNIPGYPASFFCRIPIAFLSGQPLPKPWRDEPSSQLDFAPTMAHLLNLPVQPGWWGDSLYTTNLTSPYIVRFNDKLSIGVEPGIISSTLAFDHPTDESESNLLALFNTVYVDPSPMGN
jgi:phosphoglycerol transferase MdoB-like AlkP superfamily enzyme